MKTFNALQGDDIYHMYESKDDENSKNTLNLVDYLYDHVMTRCALPKSVEREKLFDDSLKSMLADPDKIQANGLSLKQNVAAAFIAFRDAVQEINQKQNAAINMKYLEDNNFDGSDDSDDYIVEEFEDQEPTRGGSKRSRHRRRPYRASRRKNYRSLKRRRTASKK
jgi:hypothetical protein